LIADRLLYCVAARVTLGDGHRYLESIGRLLRRKWELAFSFYAAYRAREEIACSASQPAIFQTSKMGTDWPVMTVIRSEPLNSTSLFDPDQCCGMREFREGGNCLVSQQMCGRKCSDGNAKFVAKMSHTQGTCGIAVIN